MTNPPSPSPQGPDGAPAELLELFLWLAKPDVGPESLLMVLTGNTAGGPVYRPLICTTEEHARDVESLALEAATSLGVTAVLRRYTVTPIGGAS